MLALLGALPFVGNLITAVVNAFYNAKVSIATAQIGGDRDKAVELVKAAAAAEHERSTALSVIAGNKLLAFLVVAFAAPLVIFEWKVIVVDTVFNAGTTFPIKGQVADWANTIIWSIFGSAGFASAASVVANTLRK